MFRRKQESNYRATAGSILSQKEFFRKRMIKVVIFREIIASSNNNKMFRSIIIKADCKGKGYEDLEQHWLTYLSNFSYNPPHDQRKAN